MYRTIGCCIIFFLRTKKNQTLICSTLCEKLLLSWVFQTLLVYILAMFQNVCLPTLTELLQFCFTVNYGFIDSCNLQYIT